MDLILSLFEPKFELGSKPALPLHGKRLLQAKKILTSPWHAVMGEVRGGKVLYPAAFSIFLVDSIHFYVFSCISLFLFQGCYLKSIVSAATGA